MADEIPSNLTVKEMEEAGGPVSAMKTWYNRVKGASGGMQRAKVHAAAAGQGLRQGGEALLVGGTLGALSSKLKTGLDVKKVPIDAVVGVLGLLGGAAMATEEYGVDLRNAGAAGLAVFSFRKTQQIVAEKMRKEGKTPGFEAKIAGDDEGYPPHGESDIGAEDPIIAAARFL